MKYIYIYMFFFYLVVAIATTRICGYFRVDSEVIKRDQTSLLINEEKHIGEIKYVTLLAGKI